ncbi:MAG: aminoglycoside phosphotransferase family protein [Oscillospiraceae bacterium]|nr:aminoglycoside phosphotransferase family protein [Oscillospiraceae bacterium]
MSKGILDSSNMTLTGSGAQADVYHYEDKAVKIYKADHMQAEARYEADLQEKAYKAGLPVPAVFEITEYGGKAAIVMEYIKGKPLGESMLENMAKARDYINIAVDLQMMTHNIRAEGFPNQKDRLAKKIKNTSHLDSGQKEELLLRLEQLPSDDKLCHGDFHVLNLLQTPQGVKIIDWVDACSGTPAADVCRSYLLYLLYREDVAKMYLELYCKTAKIDKLDVLAWMPVIAGAKLDENVTERDVQTLKSLTNK